MVNIPIGAHTISHNANIWDVNFQAGRILLTDDVTKVFDSCDMVSVSYESAKIKNFTIYSNETVKCWNLVLFVFARRLISSEQYEGQND